VRRPKGLRALVGGALDRAGLLDRLLWLRARLGRRQLAVLTYHRVARPGGVGELDPGLVEVEQADLAAQLEVLRAGATVVSIGDVRRFRRGRKLPPNAVLVTFDDGYVEGHDVALPILRAAGVPATFFIPTAFPDAGRLFWWDRVWLTMRRCRRDEVTLDYPRRLTLHPTVAPEAAARVVCEAIKRTPGVDLHRLWDALEERTGVVLGAAEERALAGRTIMGWAQVRALRDAGMDVQSHAHEHLVLNTLTPAAAERDLAQSASALREAVGGEVFGVAYPVGYALSGALRRAPELASFELGFTNGTGLCAVDGFDPLNVPRLSMDLDIVLADYKLRLLFGSEPRARVTMLPAAT
jgi:peptidoglycan/xylan/chitin deacetylase (PgdA/CDA1 family)